MSRIMEGDRKGMVKWAEDLKQPPVDDEVQRDCLHIQMVETDDRG